MVVPSRTSRVMVGRRGLHAVLVGLRCAAAGATLGVLLAGCGGKTKTVTNGQTASQTQTQTQTQAQTQTTASQTSVIEVQRGIGTATLGMSEAQVRQSLGPPLRADQVRNSTGPYTELTYPDRLTVAFQRGGSYSGGASSFFVKGMLARTPDGIGVGSTEADVKAHVASTICEKVGGGQVASYRSCHLGKYRPGQTITEFQIDAGRVSHVRVALVR